MPSRPGDHFPKNGGQVETELVYRTEVLEMKRPREGLTRPGQNIFNLLSLSTAQHPRLRLADMLASRTVFSRRAVRLGNNRKW